MGFVGKLLGAVLGDDTKGVTDAFNKVADQAKSAAAQARTAVLNDGNRQNQARGERQVTYKDFEPYVTRKSPQVQSTTELRRLLATWFPGISIRDNVWPSEFGGQGKLPFTMVLYRMDAPVAVVQMTKKGEYGTLRFKDAKATAEAAGIPFINFFDWYPNEQQYVERRIRLLMK
jgi:hypothetical protein